MGLFGVGWTAAKITNFEGVKTSYKMCKCFKLMVPQNRCGRFVEMTTADFDYYPNTPLGRNEYHTLDKGELYHMSPGVNTS